jgi:hypothetical protein
MPLQTKEKRAGGYIDQLAFMSSESWSPARPCRAIVTVIGSGGSGAAGNGRTDTNPQSKICVTGGGAAGMAQSRLNLYPSTTYSIIVGARPSSVSAGTTVGSTAGNAGNLSSFSGTGVTTMTANGGAGGADSSIFTDGSPSATGAAGGTATGGNLQNITGGAAGDVSITASIGGSFGASGGGAVGLRGVGYDGGAISITATSGNRGAASGGGGVGGKGGNCDQPSTGGTTVSYGGGELGPALDENNNSLSPTFTPTSGIQPGVGSSSAVGIQIDVNIIGNWFYGSIPVNSGNAYWQRGVGGNGNNSTGTNTPIFGGGGGGASTGSPVSGGTPQIGAGGGAAATGTNAFATSGRGGQGMVLIQIEEYLD